MDMRRAGMALADAGEDLDDILNALDGAEVGEVDEEALFGFGEAGALAADQPRGADVTSQLTKLRMTSRSRSRSDASRVRVRRLGGDGGDSVGLLDAEFCDGQIGAVELRA